MLLEPALTSTATVPSWSSSHVESWVPAQFPIFPIDVNQFLLWVLQSPNVPCAQPMSLLRKKQQAVKLPKKVPAHPFQWCGSVWDGEETGQAGAALLSSKLSLCQEGSMCWGIILTLSQDKGVALKVLKKRKALFACSRDKPETPGYESRNITVPTSFEALLLLHWIILRNSPICQRDWELSQVYRTGTLTSFAFSCVGALAPFTQ